VAYGLGYGFIALLFLVLGLCRLLYTLVFWLVLFSGIGLYWQQRKEVAWTLLAKELAPRGTGEKVLFALALVVFGIHFVGSLVPAYGHDEMNYHLTMPRQFIIAHRIHPTPNVLQANFPFNAQMAYLFCLGLGNDILCKLTQWVQYLVIAGILVVWTRSYSPKAGYLAVLFYISTVLAVFQRVPTECGSDIPTAVFFAIGMFSISRMNHANWIRLLPILGLMNGFAWGTKFTAYPFVTLPCLAFLLLRLQEIGFTLRRTLAAIAIFLVVGLVVLSPWLLKSAVFTGNPIYPFLSEVFPSPVPYDTLAEKLFEYEQISNFYRRTSEYGLKNLDTNPLVLLPLTLKGYWDEKLCWAVFNGDGLLPLFIVFSITGLFFRDTRIRQLAVVGILLNLTFFFIYGCHLNRFFSVTYPFAAVLVSSQIARLFQKTGKNEFLISLLGCALFLQLVHFQLRWCSFLDWYGRPCLTRAAQKRFMMNRGHETEDRGWAEAVDRLTPKDACILGYGVRFPFHTDRRIYYVGDFEDELLDDLLREYGDWEHVLPELLDRGFTHILVFREKEGAASLCKWLNRNTSRLWQNDLFELFEAGNAAGGR